MNGDAEKSVHPFFKPNGLHEPNTIHTESHSAEHEVASTLNTSSALHGGQEKPPKGKKGRALNATAQCAPKGKTQKTLTDVVAPTVAAPGSLGASTDGTVDDLVSFDPVVDVSRRKRRRTGQYESVEVGQSDEAADVVESPRQPSPHVLIPASSPLPEAPAAEPAFADAPKTPPKKMLRLSANGKFSSPVSKKSKQDDDLPSPDGVKKRGRPRKAKANQTTKQLLVCLRYAGDTGRRIDQILGGEERIPIATAKKDSPKKSRTPKKPAKSTHPFFLGKPKDPPRAPKRDSPRKASATTPGKLRTQIYHDRLPEGREVPQAFDSALLKDRLMVKHPGAREPPWPDREQTHVRGLEGAVELQTSQNLPALSKRKWKNARLPFPHGESILRHFASQLVPEEDPEVRSDGFNEPHDSLGVPFQLLLSGHDIRQRMAPELSFLPLDVDTDELSLPAVSHQSIHPALIKLWTALPETMTAFDEGRGEALSWTQKYAPSAATEVLQSAREMGVLRDWLMSLTVTAVETAGKSDAKPVSKAEARPRKKRRRKPDDLDDFLVDSDEEIHNMDELADPVDVPSNPNIKAQRSVIQMASAGTKLSNAVLLSGPRGCGKTVAAFAVAKELGFKVFEISPCERRSGKDVLDRVGDMTENHLVKHHGIDAGELSSTEEPNKARMDEAFQRDLESGRQGKMASFFQPQLKSAKVPAEQKKLSKAKTLEAVQKALKKPAKDQQQSLILLEEVDILFRDDKDFWTTVLKLIATSKRPFIMTCNDEDLVPLQAMALHAILRFTPPALDLAVDYLLLIAASEGHLLRREKVFALYYAKLFDLRASIADLDFWCQMGVGDPRGGLSWIYQRWPPGSDVDQLGRKLRVVSEGTYDFSMNFRPDTALGEEWRMRWIWRELNLGPTKAPWYGVPSSPGAGSEEQPVDSRRRLDDLRSFANFADSMSAMDVFTSRGLPGSAPLDTTQPTIPDKARNQYIEGLPLLQTDEQIDYLDISSQLAVACALAAWRVHHEETHPTDQQSAPTPEELRLTHRPQDQRFEHPLPRRSFAVFDPISVPSDATSTGLTQSAFDGPLSIITTDLAPYVRSIVHYDLALEEQRDLLTAGQGKKARTTRAARSALEGSQRSVTRRERWFAKGLDLVGVLKTGGEGWGKMVALREEGSREGSEGAEVLCLSVEVA